MQVYVGTSLAYQCSGKNDAFAGSGDRFGTLEEDFLIFSSHFQCNGYGDTPFEFALRD